MSTSPEVKIPVAVYMVGLGRVGSVILSRFVELHRKAFRYTTVVDRFQRFGLGVEPEIIDMCLEPEVRKLIIDEGLLNPADHVRHLVANAEVYDIRSGYMRFFASFYMPSLLRYLTIVHENIRGLSQGSGVCRYRPLARYFLYHIIENTQPFLRSIIEDVEKDLSEDLKPLGPAYITDIYATSLGGGFGSGSFLDISSIVDRYIRKIFEGKPHFKFFLFALPTRFELTPRSEDLVLSQIEESKASAAAALLEFLLALRTRERGGYVDSLTSLASKRLGITDFSICMDPNAYIGIFLASYRDIFGRDIDEIYRKFDDEAAAFLTALIQHLLPIELKDVQQREAYFPSYRGVAEKLGYPLELLQSVATYSARVIRLDFTPLTESKLRQIYEEIRAKEDEVDTIEGIIKSEEKELESFSKALNTIEDLMKSISKWREEGAVLRPEFKKLFDDIRAKFDELGNAVGTALTAVQAKMHKDARKILQQVLTTMNVNVVGNINAILDEARKLLEVLAGAVPRTREIIEFVKSVVAKGAPEVRNRAMDLVNNVEKLKDLITNAAYAETVIRSLEDLISLINRMGVSAILENIVQEVAKSCRFGLGESCKVKNFANQLLNRVNELLNLMKGSVSGIRNCLNDVNSKLKDLTNELRKAINVLKNEIDMRSALIEDKRHQLENLREEIQRLRSTLDSEIANVIAGLIVKNPYLSRRVAQEIISLMLEQGIEFVTRLTLSELYRELLKRNKDVADELVNCILRDLEDFYRGAPYRVSHVPLEILAKLLGLDEESFRTRELRYLILSADEKELQRIFAEYFEGKGVITIVDDTIEGPYIAAIKMLFGVPLIAVNEVRELILNYAAEVRRRVYKVVKVKEGFYRFTGEDEYVTERRGNAFHVLELDEGAKKFIDEVISKVEELDRLLKQIGY